MDGNWKETIKMLCDLIIMAKEWLNFPFHWSSVVRPTPAEPTAKGLPDVDNLFIGEGTEGRKSVRDDIMHIYD